MAYTSGTATDYKNLLAIVASYADANGWDILEQTTSRLYLKGTGTSGTDEIYCGIETYEVPASGFYNWELFGSVSWRSGRELHLQPLSSGDDQVFCYFWNSPIPYWIVATPRRIMGFAKVGTTYQPFHLGLAEPCGTDAQYPYPLFIGGAGAVAAQAYSVATTAIRGFWNGPVSSTRNGRLRLPGGTWGSLTSASGSVGNPTIIATSARASQAANILSSPGGIYRLEQIYLTDATCTDTYAYIDGLYRISGYGQTAENIITIDGVNYMVFPDIFRGGNENYCAMRLS